MSITRRKFVKATSIFTLGFTTLFKTKVAKPSEHRELLGYKLHDKVSVSLLKDYARCMALEDKYARWQAQMWFHEVNRFWNAFGIGNIFESGSSSIVVEINSPFEGINRQIGGVFMQDKSGRIYLGHRGGVGGGRLGIGKTAFMASMDLDELVEIHDGDEVSEVVVIGALNAAEFCENVAEFVHKVERFKSTV